jgi:hypothetical protein
MRTEDNQRSESRDQDQVFYPKLSRRGFLQTVSTGAALAGGLSMIPSVRGEYERQLTEISPPGVKWNNTYKTRGNGWANDIIAGQRGEIIFVGQTQTEDDFGNAWIQKLSSSGETQWSKVFGGDHTDFASSVVATANGEYLFCGHTESAGQGKGDAWLIQVDQSGNRNWGKIIGSSGEDWASSVIQSPDTGFLFAGQTESDSDSGTAWLVKVDREGNTQWRKRYQTNTSSWLRSVVISSKGGFLAAGASASEAISHGLLVKVNSSGELEWKKIFDDKNGWIREVTEVDDGFVFTGAKQIKRKEGSDAWLAKVNYSGEKQWEKTYANNRRNIANDIIKTTDDAFLIAGRDAASGNKSGNAWLIKIDKQGDIQWQNTYGGNRGDTARSVIELKNSGYVFAGQKSSILGNRKAWVVKTGVSTTPTRTPTPTPASTPSPTSTPTPTTTPELDVDIQITPTPAIVGQPVEFTFSHRTSDFFNITSLRWDVDEDGGFEGEGNRTTYVFNNSGRKRISLTVETHSGVSNTYSRQLLVGVDPDGDGLISARERARGLDPNNPDTDSDLFNDRIDPMPKSVLFPTTTIQLLISGLLYGALFYYRE